MPYKTALGHVYDSGNFKQNLSQCVKNSKYLTFDNRKKQSTRENKIGGIGVSTYIEACGGGGPEYASLKVGRNGNIEVKIRPNLMGKVMLPPMVK